MTTGIDQLLAEKGIELRDFGLTFANMIANLAVDPHGYFEKKYTARIESARSEHEINGVLAQLVQWAASSSVSDAERAQLNKRLSEHGFPQIDDLRSCLLP
jgi:hypothetical protein